METSKGVILHTLITIILTINVTAIPFNEFSSENSENVLSRLLNRGLRRPVVILINKSSKQNGALRSVLTSNQIKTGDNKINLDDAIDEDKAKQYMIDILRSTGDEKDPTVKEANMKFERALRARCTLEFECEIKCKPIKKPKQKENCYKTCKEVYDHLMLCNPPGGKKKKNYCESSDECVGKPIKWGKTLPPSWRY